MKMCKDENKRLCQWNIVQELWQEAYSQGQMSIDD
jgi:hypothetical protein